MGLSVSEVFRDITVAAVPVGEEDAMIFVYYGKQVRYGFEDLTQESIYSFEFLLILSKFG